MSDAMEPYRFTPGAAPLLVSMPHVGTHLPAGIAGRMTEAARAVPDTDWHVDRLYDFLGPDSPDRLGDRRRSFSTVKMPSSPG